MVLFCAIVQFSQNFLEIFRNLCEILPLSSHSQVKVSFCQMTYWNRDVKKSCPKFHMCNCMKEKFDKNLKSNLGEMQHLQGTQMANKSTSFPPSIPSLLLCIKMLIFSRLCRTYMMPPMCLKCSSISSPCSKSPTICGKRGWIMCTCHGSAMPTNSSTRTCL